MSCAPNMRNVESHQTPKRKTSYWGDKEIMWIGCPLLCLGLNSHWTLPLHKWLRVLAECSRATMINVVIKPAGRLLSVTLDHLVWELGYVHWSDTKPRAVRTHQKQISHQTLIYSRLTHTHKNFLCNVTQLWKSLMALKCHATEVIFAVQNTLKLFFCWFCIRSLIGMLF